MEVGRCFTWRGAGKKPEGRLCLRGIEVGENYDSFRKIVKKKKIKKRKDVKSFK